MLEWGSGHSTLWYSQVRSGFCQSQYLLAKVFLATARVWNPAGNAAPVMVWTLLLPGTYRSSPDASLPAEQFVRDYYSIEHHEAWAGKMAKDVEHVSNIHYKFAGAPASAAHCLPHTRLRLGLLSKLQQSWLPGSAPCHPEADHCAQASVFQE